jgi:hypothetical protein
MKIISMILGFILVSFFIASCSLNNDNNVENFENDSEFEDTQVTESDIDEVIDQEFIDENEFLSDEYNEFGSMI